MVMQPRDRDLYNATPTVAGSGRRVQDPEVGANMGSSTYQQSPKSSNQRIPKLGQRSDTRTARIPNPSRPQRPYPYGQRGWTSRTSTRLSPFRFPAPRSLHSSQKSSTTGTSVSMIVSDSDASVTGRSVPWSTSTRSDIGSSSRSGSGWARREKDQGDIIEIGSIQSASSRNSQVMKMYWDRSF